MTIAATNPGRRNLKLTDTGRRKKNIGKMKNNSTVNPPERNPSVISSAEYIHARFQSEPRMPYSKNIHCAAPSRKALSVAGVPSIAVPSERKQLEYIAAATTPARAERRLLAAT